MQIQTKRPNRLILASVCLALGAAATGAISFASAQSGPTQTIRACVIDPDGDGAGTLLQTIGPTGRCLPGQSLLTWNVQGPPGERGPAGPAGVLGFYSRSSPNVSIAPGQEIERIVSCDQGDLVTGGGYVADAVSLPPANLVVSQSFPPNNREWTVIARNAGAGSIGAFIVIVRCADVTP